MIIEKAEELGIIEEKKNPYMIIIKTTISMENFAFQLKRSLIF